jgi:protein-S-isoprenylcysteine O-methyltransferase Ste14
MARTPILTGVNVIIGGLYRYVRNRMYVAATVAIIGQALLIARTRARRAARLQKGGPNI